MLEVFFLMAFSVDKRIKPGRVMKVWQLCFMWHSDLVESLLSEQWHFVHTVEGV